MLEIWRRKMPCLFPENIFPLICNMYLYYERMFSGWITLDYIHNVNMNKCLESDEWYDWIHSWGRRRGKRLKQDWQTEYSENINCKEKYFWWSRFMWGRMGSANVHAHAQVSSVQFSKLNNRMICGKNFTRFKWFIIQFT